MLLEILIILALLYLGHELGSAYRSQGQGRRLPGPRALPLIGNLHQHPTKEPWLQYHEWRRKYGPLVQLQLGLRTVIILGTRQAVDDLLIRRGKQYCTHPQFAFFGDCMAGNSLPTQLPHGEHRRAMHRLITSVLTPSACQAYGDLQDRESLRMALKFLQPGSNIQHIWEYAVGLSSTLVYGDGTAANQMSDVVDIQEIFQALQGVVSKKNLILELYPVLNRLPGPLNRWRRAGESYRARFLQIWTRRVQSGLQSTNWNWTRIMHDNKPAATTDEEFPFLLAELELGLTLTTSIMLRMFLATTLHHPAATHRVRDELDAVVGAERTPRLDDQDRLPLLRGFMLEMLRWHSLMPLSLPYASPETGDEYMGYQIPAGAMLIVNQWALNMDPGVYIDPEIFRPERWVENPGLPEPVIFGYGRRICPGALFARNSMMLTFAKLLWAFDIRPLGKGVQDLPPHQRHTALALQVKWPTDRTRLAPRSDGRIAVMEAELQASPRTDAELLDQAARQVRLQLAKA